MLMLGLKFFAAKIMGKLHFKILQHTLIPKFRTVKLSDKYRVQKFYRPKFIESENFIALYYIEILQSISLDSIIYSTNLLSGTPEPGGWGAVAPTFLLVVHDVKIVTFHQKKVRYLLSMLKAYLFCPW